MRLSLGKMTSKMLMQHFPTVAGQLYLVVVVSDFSLLELLSEQDQGLIAGKWTPPEVFGAQGRSLQVCRGLLVLTRVSSKAF